MCEDVAQLLCEHAATPVFLWARWSDSCQVVILNDDTALTVASRVLAAIGVLSDVPSCLPVSQTRTVRCVVGRLQLCVSWWCGSAGCDPSRYAAPLPFAVFHCRSAASTSARHCTGTRCCCRGRAGKCVARLRGLAVHTLTPSRNQRQCVAAARALVSCQAAASIHVGDSKLGLQRHCCASAVSRDLDGGSCCDGVRSVLFCRCQRWLAATEALT